MKERKKRNTEAVNIVYVSYKDSSEIIFIKIVFNIKIFIQPNF